MTSDIDLYRSANLWIELHGGAAMARALEMMGRIADRQDAAGVVTWRRIISAVEMLQGQARHIDILLP